MSDIVGMTPISPDGVWAASKETKQRSSLNFTDVLAAATPVTGALAYTQAGNNAGLLTSATMTGVVGATQTYGPYSQFLQTASPFPSGGYPYGSVPFNAGYMGPGATVPTSSPYGVPGAPSQDYMEKQALFQQMNDANWEMLTAQVEVNAISRDYTAWSNILAEKRRTEGNILQNFRA